jgi:O-antigen/teichoic acid export membrane protein
MRKNILFTSILFVLSKVFVFIVRRYLALTLGVDYLGIISVFNSIYAIFSIFELSLGAFISVYIYKFVREKKTIKLSYLYNFSSKVYLYLTVFLVSIFVVISIYSTYFSSELSNIPFVSLAFAIFTISYSVSNRFSYVQYFLIALEKNFIIVFYENLFLIGSLFLQYLLLLLFNNILIYFLIQGLMIIAPKIFIQVYFKRKFPELISLSLKQPIIVISKNNIVNFFKIFYPIVHLKLVGILINNLDILIAASLINFEVLGVYSNYILIIAIINQFMEQLQRVFTPVINRIFNNNRYLKQKLFLNFFNLNFFLVIFSSILLSFLLNLFLEFWFGKLYLLSDISTFLIIFGFFSSNLRRPFWIINHINGYYKFFILSSLFELFLFISLTFVFFPIFNLDGILISLLLARNFAYLSTDINVLYKMNFITSKFKFFLLLGTYLIVGGIIIFTLVNFLVPLNISYQVLLFLILSLLILIFLFKNSKFLLNS